MRRGQSLHIADIQLPCGLVVEIQHSKLSAGQVHDRERFYDNMVWIVDGLDTTRVGGMYHDVAVLTSVKGCHSWWGVANKPVLVDTSCGLVLLPTRRAVSAGNTWCGQMCNQHNISPTLFDWLSAQNKIGITASVRDMRMYQQYSQYTRHYQKFMSYADDSLCGDVLQLAHCQTCTTLPDETKTSFPKFPKKPTLTADLQWHQIQKEEIRIANPETIEVPLDAGNHAQVKCQEVTTCVYFKDRPLQN